MRISPKLAILSLFAAATLALHADTYNYTIIAGDPSNPSATFNATGAMTGTMDPHDSNAIVLSNITGAALEYTFTGVVTVPGSPTDSMTPVMDPATKIVFDNVVYNPNSNSPSIDTYGVLLTMTNGTGTSYGHVYNTDSGFVVDVLDPGDPTSQTPFEVAASLSVLRFSTSAVPESPVPEPATWLLLGTGSAAAVGMAMRRRKMLHNAA